VRRGIANAANALRFAESAGMLIIMMIGRDAIRQVGGGRRPGAGQGCLGNVSSMVGTGPGEAG
jgi:hypothetical protein